MYRRRRDRHTPVGMEPHVWPISWSQLHSFLRQSNSYRVQKSCDSKWITKLRPTNPKSWWLQHRHFYGHRTEVTVTEACVCVSVHACVWMHLCTGARAWVCVCCCMHAHVCKSDCVRSRACFYVWLYVCVWVWVNEWVSVCVNVYVYDCVCVCVSVSKWVSECVCMCVCSLCVLCVCVVCVVCVFCESVCVYVVSVCVCVDEVSDIARPITDTIHDSGQQNLPVRKLLSPLE
jgi:hypothetical protein